MDCFLLCSHISAASLRSTTNAEIDAFACRDMYSLRRKASKVYADPEVTIYAHGIVSAIRRLPSFRGGLSSRVDPAFEAAIRVVAVLDDSSFLSPAHVLQAALPALRHKFALDGDDSRDPDAVIRDVLLSMEPPV